MSIIDQIRDKTAVGDMNTVAELTNQAIADGIAPDDIIQHGLIEAMTIVGDKFKKNEIYVPEMLIAARAMKTALGILKPLMVGQEAKRLAKVVIGTVKGDLHDIGKNLVSIMMEGAGIEVMDLGVDVAPEKFLEAIKAHQPQFLAMSALLTTTMPNLKTTIDVVAEAGVDQNLKVLIGGAPVTQKFADEIGADGYADNAATAVDAIKALL
ncbi:MAG: corrinoid protein [Desulfobacterales bacterium]|nr:MAG: corrinoid protein [Desulfobacterales bacterium]